jgi:hypothetical protein
MYFSREIKKKSEKFLDLERDRILLVKLTSSKTCYEILDNIRLNIMPSS